MTTVTFPGAAPADPRPRVIAPAPYNDRIQRRIGNNLTPQVVTPILSQAELGYLWCQADLLDEIRDTDLHLQGVLYKREQRIAGAEWTLEAPEGSGDEGAAIAKFCTEALKGIEARHDLERSFCDALADLQGAVYQGRAVEEVTWRQDGRWWLPDTLSFVHPRRLAYALDWRLHLWDSSGTGASALEPSSVGGPFGVFPGIPLDRFPPGKFLVHRPRIKGMYPTREGLGRVLVWYALFKRWSLRDWLAFLAWAGRGFRIGKYNAGADPNVPRATPEDVTALEIALEAFSSATQVVIPDTTDIDIKAVAGQLGEAHDRLATFCDAQMSKAVEGGTLGTDAGDKGARSLGDVHQDEGLMIARGDARSIGATVRRDLVRPMVQMNFGPRAPVPSMLIAVDPKEDLKELAERGKTYVSSGGTLGQRSWRAKLNLPAPEADEEVIRMAPAPGAAPGVPPTPPGETPPTPGPGAKP
jgi:phage gp29-like protein